jgi:hypothetical protein
VTIDRNLQVAPHRGQCARAWSNIPHTLRNRLRIKRRGHATFVRWHSGVTVIGAAQPLL